VSEASVSSLVGLRYAPERQSRLARPRGHVESYFLKANDPRSRRAVWLKTTIYASERASDRANAIAEAWAIAFDADRGHVAVKTSVPFEQARFDRRAIDAEVAGVALSARGSHGAIDSGGRTVAWDLSLASDGLPLVHYPHAWMYEGKFPSSKLVSPFPDLRATGSLTVNGERWDIDRWPGMLGHNWGPRHAPLYAWGHCNVWERDDGSPLEELVFEGVSGRVAVGPVMSPLMTLLCLRWRGVRFDLNAASCLVTNSAEVTPRHWAFAGEDRFVRISGELWASTDDFVGLFYENPSGPTTHCLNSKLAHAKLEVEVRGRAPFTAHSRAAALEIGTTDPTHGVRMYV
jgi:hypothetical protein